MSVNKIGVKKGGKTSPKTRLVSPPVGSLISITYPSQLPENSLINAGDAGGCARPQGPSLEDELKTYIDWYRYFCRQNQQRRRITRTVLRKWTDTFREAAMNLPKVEPFIRYNGGPIDVEINRRLGMDLAVNLLREAANYLQSLPTSGQMTNFDEVWCVSLMCDAYRRHTKDGGPRYDLVTKRMLKEFPKLIKEPKDKKAWARDRELSWKRLQKDQTAMGLLRRQRERLEILDKYPVEVPDDTVEKTKKVETSILKNYPGAKPLNGYASRYAAKSKPGVNNC
jgi:hypothetical protein